MQRMFSTGIWFVISEVSFFLDFCLIFSITYKFDSDEWAVFLRWDEFCLTCNKDVRQDLDPWFPQGPWKSEEDAWFSRSKDYQELQVPAAELGAHAWKREVDWCWEPDKLDPYAAWRSGAFWRVAASGYSAELLLFSFSCSSVLRSWTTDVVTVRRHMHIDLVTVRVPPRSGNRVLHLFRLCHPSLCACVQCACEAPPCKWGLEVT